jgi:hypothetical protein
MLTITLEPAELEILRRAAHYVLGGLAPWAPESETLDRATLRAAAEKLSVSPYRRVGTDRG